MSDTEQQPLTDREITRLEELNNTAKEDLSTDQLTSRTKLSLKRRYSYPDYSMVFEFPAPNGRRADAIAFCLRKSRNWKTIGFEIKASRSDWLSEKKDAAKADWFVRQVDEWYIVAADTGIVNKDELPQGWGLLVMKSSDDRLWKEVESDLKESQSDPPHPGFWGRAMKEAVGPDSNYSKRDVEEARRRGYAEAKRKVDKRAQMSLDDRNIHDKAAKWDQLQNALTDHDLYFSSFRNEIDERDLRKIQHAYWLVENFNPELGINIDYKLGRLQSEVERHSSEIIDKLIQARWRLAFLTDELGVIERGDR